MCNPFGGKPGESTIPIGKPADYGNPTDPGSPSPMNPEPGAGNPGVDPERKPVEEPTLTPPAPVQPTPPAAAPLPTVQDPSVEEITAQRLRRLARLRLGLNSTIKTSPQGDQASPLVSTPALYSPGTKGKLGE